MDADYERPVPSLLEELAAFSSATIHEANGQRGAVSGALKPLDPAMRVCGSALTVHCPAGDNLMIHAAIAVARPGDVLVVDHQGALDDGPFGDLLAEACLARGIRGLVIDGCVRDATTIRQMNFPVFARGLCIKGTTKNRLGSIGRPISLAGVPVAPGDAILGDEDGVVVVRRADIAGAIAAAIQREAKEAAMREAIRNGACTLDLLDLRNRLSAIKS